MSRTKTRPHTNVEASSRLKKIPDHIQTIAGVLSALAVIAGALLGAGKWIVKEVSASTSSRIDALEQKMDSQTKENKLAIMRVEIMTLIEQNPENTLEIEKYAREYFALGGDTYLTGLVSDWCAEQGINCGEIMLK